MPLRLTARHRARLAASRRIAEILTEQAELFAQYPELRADPKRPGVLKNNDIGLTPRAASATASHLGVVEAQSSIESLTVKKYTVS
jgi:hypothetical protein